MNDRILLAIHERARHAHSDDELVQAIFDTFRAAEIHPRDVSLEDMKSALVQAVRASRGHEAVTMPV